jgi:hypothetical protein
VEWLAGSDVPVAYIEERVGIALEFIRVWEPGEWSAYLPTNKCAVSIVCSGPSRGKELRRLLDLAKDVSRSLEKHSDLQQQSREWLNGNQGALDIKNVQAKRIELETVVWERDNRSVETDLVQVLLRPADAVEGR